MDPDTEIHFPSQVHVRRAPDGIGTTSDGNWLSRPTDSRQVRELRWVFAGLVMSLLLLLIAMLIAPSHLSWPIAHSAGANYHNRMGSFWGKGGGCSFLGAVRSPAPVGHPKRRRIFFLWRSEEGTTYVPDPPHWLYLLGFLRVFPSRERFPVRQLQGTLLTCFRRLIRVTTVTR